MASQIFQKTSLAINGKIIQTLRSQPIFTCCSLSKSETRQLDQKYALMKKEVADEHKAHAAGLITIQKNEVLTPITGVPEEHVKGRRVKISLALKNPMQSGTDNTHSWVMDFETRERWENPLMGWSSTGDPLSNMSLQFTSKEAAIEFCDKNGWEWFVEKEKPKAQRVKNYGVNFSWNKRTRVSTK